MFFEGSSSGRQIMMEVLIMIERTGLMRPCILTMAVDFARVVAKTISDGLSC